MSCPALMDKKSLSERDVCTKFITPALQKAGWDVGTRIREEVSFTKGRITVRGRLDRRGWAKRADCILYLKPNIPLAIFEAKDNNHSVGDGLPNAAGLMLRAVGVESYDVRREVRRFWRIVREEGRGRTLPERSFWR
jgi:hypothetical protein